jgi:multisubunit Na+/H+ antiporter MnhB subunit
MDIAGLGVVAGVIQAIVFFAFLTAVIVLPRYFRSRDRAKLHETLRIAYEKGQPVPPELIAALTREDAGGPSYGRVPTPDRDFRRGLVLVFIGLGFATAAYALYLGIGVFSDTGAWITGECVAAIGAIPGFIGLAYLVLWWAKRNSARS